MWVGARLVARVQPYLSITQRAAILPPAAPLWLNHIFRHYLINGMIFRKKKFTEHKMCTLILPTTFTRKTFLIIRRIQRDIVINAKTSSYQVPVILVGFS